MKLTALMLLVFCIQASAHIKAQSVSIEGTKMPLNRVFEVVQQQTGYHFLYSNEVMRKAMPVTIRAKSLPLAQVLDSIFRNQPLTYIIDSSNTILIRSKPVLPISAELIAAEKQLTEITGSVTDSAGNPLQGVSVRIKGLTKGGTITNERGAFLLRSENPSPVLIFSFVGYDTREVAVNNRTHIEVMLRTANKKMDEVVVTGYQRIERRSLTSSITTVNMENLKTINQPSLDKLLQGQVPGMTIMSTSGAPGSVPQIRIRGTSTISGNVQPLWVVDGIILDDPINASVDDIAKNRNLIASGIGGINVEDIETISVLKDAAATAIYGTKAANGVIVVTSKKGSSGKTRMNFNSYLTMGMRPRIEDAYMMNSKERIDVNLEMINRGLLNAGSGRNGQYGTISDFEKYFIDVHDRKISWAQFEDKVRQLEEVNTDWFKQLFRNSITTRHNLSISGGNEKTTFYISGSYMDDQATAKKTGQKTYTGSVKVYTRLTKNLRAGALLDVNVRDNKSFFATDSRENPFEWSIYTTRAQNAFDENGNFNHFYYNGMKYNFMENREYGWRNSKSSGLRGTADIEWRPVSGLLFNSLFNFTRQNTAEEDVATENSYFVKKRQQDITTTVDYQAVQLWKEGGYKKGRSTINSSVTWRNQLSYMPNLGYDHRIDLMAGQELRKSLYEDETTEIYGYVHERGRQQVPQFELMKYLGTPYWRQSLNQSAAVSYFGVAGYTFRNRYTVSFNARTDGSNRFGLKTNQLFQPLWAIGANYQLKEESWFADKEWMSYLTLRGSYGSQGNVAAQAYSDLVTNIGVSDGLNPNAYLTINAPRNPNLKWEMNYTTNLALEFGFWKRRLTGTIEYYNKKGMDLLGTKQVSQVSGFTTVQVNWASMKNSGVEFSLNGIPVDGKNFRWTVNANAGFNKNEVLDVYSVPTVNTLTDAQRTNYAASAVVGKPVNGLWSYRYAGLNKDGRATFYNNKPGQTVLYGMTSIDGLTYSGTTMPTMQGGLTNSFYYKKFTLSALVIGSFGNVIRLRNFSQGSGFGFPEATQNLPREWVNRWKQPGDEAHTDIPKFESDPWDFAVTGAAPYNGRMYDNSDLRTVKGDFVRLQNVSISYDFYTQRLRAAGVQNIRFMLQGNNLHVWKNDRLKGQDPEATGSVMKYDATNTANVSFGNTYLPLPRSFSFSVSVQF